MDVFISWSGARSRKIAEGFHKWLPMVLQTVVPFFSPDDIDKGSKWDPEITGPLEKSKVGIFCLTPESLDSKWLNFEAGAIATKPREKTLVCTYLYDLKESDVGQPLNRFQATTAEKADTKKLLEDINKRLDQPVVESVFNQTFEAMWPIFEVVLKEVSKMDVGNPPAPREAVEVLEEISSGVKTLYQERADQKAYRYRLCQPPHLFSANGYKVQVSGHKLLVSSRPHRLAQISGCVKV